MQLHDNIDYPTHYSQIIISLVPNSARILIPLHPLNTFTVISAISSKFRGKHIQFDHGWHEETLENREKLRCNIQGLFSEVKFYFPHPILTQFVYFGYVLISFDKHQSCSNLAINVRR